MRPRTLTRLLAIILLLGLAGSCAKPQVKPPEGTFYVTSEFTYLWDNPGHRGNVSGQLYKGDEVKLLDGESHWWRVELLRSGQSGWIQKELLTSDPVTPPFFYVNENGIPLLECPRSDCPHLQLLTQGEQVQRVEQGDQGWWRVLVLKSRSLGWLPAAYLAERMEDAWIQRPQKPFYYVAIRRLNLRADPSPRGEIIRILPFNAQVQKIGETPEGWYKVRQPASGAVGWVTSRDLNTLPMRSPRGEPGKERVKPFKPREEPQVQPQFM